MNPTNETEILNPVKSVQLSAEKVEVRELRWADALEFLKKLSAHAGELVTIGPDGKISAEVDVQKISSVILGADDLVGFLIARATVKDANWFSALSLSDAVTLLDAVLELNLREDLLKKTMALGRHFRAIQSTASLKP